ncbi:MAG: exo-alpha-sialidase [Asgard group archaeon]|nr:exo-alpha-sialidase [Asgard group archaeon]
MFKRKLSLFSACVIFCLAFSLTGTAIKGSTTIGPNIPNTDPFILGFSDNILLSTDDISYPHHVEPTIAIGDDDTIYAGWKNANGHNTGGVRVAFTKSMNGGKSFSNPSYMDYITEGITGQSDPWMVFSDNRLYYAYLEYSITGPYISQITVATTMDGGAVWNYANGTDGDYFADKETMTVDNNGNIYIVYDDVGPETYVRLTRSSDFGLSFSERNIIVDSVNEPYDHVGPYVTTDSNNNIYVAWLRYTSENWGDVYISKSETQGMTFSTPMELNPIKENGTFTVSLDGYPSKVTLPVIRFDQNDRLYAMWNELSEVDGSWGIVMRFSDDYGEIWSDRFQINQNVTGDQWQPDFDIDSKGRLHIVYYDLQSNYFRPYYRMAFFENNLLSSITITDAIPITEAETSSTFTRPGDYFTVRVDSKDIPHVVWSDGRNGEMDIYYSHGIKETRTGLIIGVSIGGCIVVSATIVTIIITVKRRK